MTYNEENGAAGFIPEFGAIFMASTLTKKECFKRNVFALPSSAAEFVKHVKTGMILFLFEFERRQLFGVFQASSDGAIDIVPHGFTSSRRPFPAQVRFTPIWSCYPLSEKEFQNAIAENYYSSKKFNFGLSKDQVHRLLCLFSSRKMKKKLPPRLPTEFCEEAADKDRGVVDDERFALSERVHREPSDYNILSDYRGFSLTRATENVVNTEENVTPVAQGLMTNYLVSKRRRVNYDDELLMNEVPEYETYNDQDRSSSLYIDHPMDPPDEVKRLLDRRQLFREYNENQLDNRRRLFREYNENQVDTNVDPFLSSKYSVSPLEGRTPYDDRLIPRDRLFSESNLENGSGQAFASEQYGIAFNKNRHAIYERIESELSPCTRSVAGLSSENFVSQLHCNQNFPILEGRIAENMDNILYSAASNKKSEYISSEGGQVVGDGGFTKSDRVENCKDIHKFANPVISTEYSPFSVPKQNLFSFSDKCSPEIRRSHLTVAQKFDPSMFTDATITRAVSYSPELPNVAHGCSASLAADRLSSLVRENHPHHDSLGNFYSLSKIMSSPYFMESKKSDQSLDVVPEHGNKYLSANASGHHVSLLHETNSSFLNSDLSLHRTPYTSPPADCNVPLFSKLSSPSVRTTHLENVEGEQRLLFASPSKSIEKHFALDGHLSMASQHVGEHVPRKHMDNLAGKDFICSEARDFTVDVYHPERDFTVDVYHPERDFTVDVYHPERDLSSYNNQQFRISSNMNLKERRAISEAPLSNSNNSRKSVFTRLTSGKNVQGGEDRNNTQYEQYMAASVDEVMEMLQQDNNPPPSKLRKSRVVEQSKHAEPALEEKQIQDHADISHLTVEKKKLKDPYPENAEKTDEAPKETRIVDFKRRSETKKSLVGTITDPLVDNNNTIHNGEVECPPKKILQRKKLVRPVFGKNEPAAEGVGSNQNLQLSGLTCDKGDKRGCEEGTSICEGERPNDKAGLGDVLPSPTHQSNTNKHSSIEEQKNLGAHVLQSKTDDLEEGSRKSNVGLQTGTLQISHKRTTQHKSSSLQTSKSALSGKIASTIKSLNLDKSSSEGLKLGAVCGNSREEKGLTLSKKRMKITRTWKTDMKSSIEEQNNVGAHVLQSKIDDLEEGNRKSNVGLQTSTSQVLHNETTQHESSSLQTSKSFLSKKFGSPVESLNLVDSSSDGLNLGATCGNSGEEKGLTMPKRRMKIIRTWKTDMKSSQ